MGNIEYKVLKTFVKYVDEDAYKVIQLLALSNGKFDIDISNVCLDEYQSFGERIHRFDWVCEEEPEHTVNFNDYFSADKHLDFLTDGLRESSNHNPSEAVSEMLDLEAEQDFHSEIEFRNKELEAKQSEYDKINKFEATCRKTGDRMVFTADTEEKALSLAEMYFSDGVLKIEKVWARVKPDAWDF